MSGPKHKDIKKRPVSRSEPYPGNACGGVGFNVCSNCDREKVPPAQKHKKTKLQIRLCLFAADGSVCEGCSKKGVDHSCIKDVEHQRCRSGIHKIFLNCFTIPPHLKEIIGTKIIDEMHKNMPIGMIFSDKSAHTERESEMRKLLGEGDLSCRIFAQTPINNICAHFTQGDRTYLINVMDKMSENKHDLTFKKRIERIKSSETSCIWYEQDSGENIYNFELNDDNTRDEFIAHSIIFLKKFQEVWKTTRYMHGDLHGGNVTYNTQNQKSRFKIIDLDYLSPNYTSKRINTAVTHLGVDLSDFELLLITLCNIYDDPKYTYEDVFYENIKCYALEITLFLVMIFDNSVQQEGTKKLFVEYDYYGFESEEKKDIYNKIYERFIYIFFMYRNHAGDRMQKYLYMISTYYAGLKSDYPTCNFLYYADTKQLAFSLKQKITLIARSHKQDLERALKIIIHDICVMKKPSSTVLITTPQVPQSPSAIDPMKRAAFLYDVYISYTPDNDEGGRNNRERVQRLNTILQSQGLRTCFDRDKEKISNSKFIVMCVTRKYMENVERYKCSCEYKEFYYIRDNKQRGFIFPVIMEEIMVSKLHWQGPVGNTLSSLTYYNLASDIDVKFENNAVKIVTAIKKFSALQDGICSQTQQRISVEIKNNVTEFTRTMSQFIRDFLDPRPGDVLRPRQWTICELLLSAFMWGKLTQNCDEEVAENLLMWTEMCKDTDQNLILGFDELINCLKPKVLREIGYIFAESNKKNHTSIWVIDWMVLRSEWAWHGRMVRQEWQTHVVNRWFDENNIESAETFLERAETFLQEGKEFSFGANILNRFVTTHEDI